MKIVLTGGPCAGKTTVLEAIRASFGSRVLIMPEVPTILMANGYPRPGIDIANSDAWFSSFQEVVLPFQRNMEDQYLIMAKEKGINLVLFDRGLIDGAAYMPGGKQAYLKKFNLSEAEVFKRYDQIIHLESVAVCQPELWESLKDTNPNRYEQTLELAQERDHKLKDVWRKHPNWHQIDGQAGIEGVVHSVLALIKPHLIDL